MKTSDVKMTNEILTKKFEPRTKLENAVNDVLKKSREETADLGEDMIKLGAEEVSEKTRELQKMRALLFYQQQKQKRSAKIKSKSYRKILKKERNGKKEEELNDEEKEEKELKKTSGACKVTNDR